MVSFRSLAGAAVAALAVVPGIVSAQLICATVNVNIPVSLGFSVVSGLSSGTRAVEPY